MKNQACGDTRPDSLPGNVIAEMVEPLFFWETKSAPVIGQSVELGGAEAKHAASVRRMRVGEKLQLTDGKGLRVRGVISSVAADLLTISVTEVNQVAEPKLKTVLIQALAKGDRDELAIQACTEIGVNEVIPWAASRSVSRWEGPKIAKGISRWQSIVSEAAKQSLRVYTPQVRELVSTNQLATMVSSFDLVLVLEPTAAEKLGDVTLPQQGSIALVVGPEGGIAEAEIEQLVAAGARSVALGDSVLRTSTAGIAALSVVHGQIEGWA